MRPGPLKRRTPLTRRSGLQRAAGTTPERARRDQARAARRIERVRTQGAGKLTAWEATFVGESDDGVAPRLRRYGRAWGRDRIARTEEIRLTEGLLSQSDTSATEAHRAADRGERPTEASEADRSVTEAGAATIAPRAGSWIEEWEAIESQALDDAEREARRSTSRSATTGWRRSNAGRGAWRGEWVRGTDEAAGASARDEHDGVAGGTEGKGETPFAAGRAEPHLPHLRMPRRRRDFPIVFALAGDPATTTSVLRTSRRGCASPLGPRCGIGVGVAGRKASDCEVCSARQYVRGRRHACRGAGRRPIVRARIRRPRRRGICEGRSRAPRVRC